MEQLLTAVGMLIVFALVLVAAVMVTKWVAKRFAPRGQSGAGPARNLRVIDKMALAPDRTLMIVEAAGKTILLGITAQHIEKLCDIDPEGLLSSGLEAAPSFSEAFKKALKANLGIKGKKGKEEPHE